MTSAPSSTLTFMIWLSMRALIWIEAIACTVPTASITIGIGFGVDLGDDHGDRPARVQPATAALRLRRSGRTGRAPFSAALAAAQTQLLRDLVAINIASPADRNRDHREDRQTDHPHPKLSRIPSPWRDYRRACPARTVNNRLF